MVLLYRDTLSMCYYNNHLPQPACTVTSWMSDMEMDPHTWRILAGRRLARHNSILLKDNTKIFFTHTHISIQGETEMFDKPHVTCVNEWLHTTSCW